MATSTATDADVKDVFILGMNEFNEDKLHAVPEAGGCRFHTLLTLEESHGAAKYDIDTLMRKSVKGLEEHPGGADAVIGFWDFPVSIMQTILAERFGLRGAPPASVFRCEHKLWSRIKQREIIPEMAPPFAGFDISADNPRAAIDLDYPFWVKPAKSFGGHMGYHVANDDDFDRAVAGIRKRIARFEEPFRRLLEMTDPPAEFDPDDPCFCIAEGIIDGNQCTLEGYACEGSIDMHGIIDSHRIPGGSSFDYFQYPSALPEGVGERMRDAARKVMPHLGFNNAAFNIEFFWDEDTDKIWLLEINPRISQSHADLFHKVDGVPNHKITLDVALGRPPRLPAREGPYEVAGKFFVRHLKNGVVRKAPGERELRRLKEAVPDIHVDLRAEEGQKLEDLDFQDSYSYKLAILYFGGESGKDMQETFRKAKEILGYEIEDLE